MNDEEIFADLGHFVTVIPVEATMKQGRAIRRRRRVIGGGTLAAAAALAIVAPLAWVGGSGQSGQSVQAGSGPRIVVDRPVRGAADQILVSGTYNDAPWSLTVSSDCYFGQLSPNSDCLWRGPLRPPANTPVELVMDDVKDPEGSHYFYAFQYSSETDFTVVTLSTGDQVTVPGFDVGNGQRIAWLPAPRATPITKVVAYREDGTEIGHTPDWGKDFSDSDVSLTWYRPDGTRLASASDVVVASGTAGGADWSITATIGPTGRCFVSRINAVPTTTCPPLGAQVYMNNAGKPGAKDGFVLGQVTPETSRVDVTFKDGTVRHLTPNRSGGHVFVGTYVPAGATVVSVTPR